MGLASRVEGSFAFVDTAFSFVFSKPPVHSEILRERGARCQAPKAGFNLNESLFPLEKNVNYLLSFAQKNVSYPNWDRFPWAEKKDPEILKIIQVLIPFTDNLITSVDPDYFPSARVRPSMQGLCNYNGPLDIPGQLSAIGAKPETIIWDAYLLALAIRVFARNRDEKMGVKTNIEDSEKVLSKFPAFPQFNLEPNDDQSLLVATNGGDWYHFWTCIVLGAFFEKYQKIYNAQNPLLVAYRKIFENSADWSDFLRKQKNRCGLHEYPDKLGFETGRRITQIKSEFLNQTF